MNILIINAFDIEGGAARAAYRLHKSLLAAGENSQMLVQNKTTDESAILGPVTKAQKMLNKVQPFLNRYPLNKYKHRSSTLFSPSWVPFGSLVERINKLHPDIVHLHWIANGMMRIEDITRINAPIVWSLHDMWPITGGCHYDDNCGAFKRNCGSCPVLGSKSKTDLSRIGYNQKNSVYSKKKNITVVGLSKWLAHEAQFSTLFGNHQVLNLPNPIDTEIYAPFDKAQSRLLFDFPQNKKLILFGAMGATKDPRKGYNELVLALRELKSRDVELVVFGASEPTSCSTFNQKIHYMGLLHDDLTLRLLYNAADVMVVPSLQENFSNAILESMSCGTPVVGFNIGGNSDLIDHKINGYLAQPFFIDDLAKGIDTILTHDQYEKLSTNARNKILKRFDSKIVSKQYIDLFKKILRNQAKEKSL